MVSLIVKTPDKMKPIASHRWRQDATLAQEASVARAKEQIHKPLTPK